MLFQSITIWGNSLHVPSLLWEWPHSDTINIIVLVWVISVKPTNKVCCHFLQPWRCLIWRVDESCKLLHEQWYFVHHPAAGSLTLEFEWWCAVWSSDSNKEDDVDRVRMRLFSQKTRDVERIPPTSDALEQHLKRSIFQASVWTTAHMYVSLSVWICVM